MYRFHARGERGMSIVELIVVIAIIGLLSSIILASVNGARAKGRDGKRASDMAQLQLALKLYAESEFGYPDCEGGFSFDRNKKIGNNCVDEGMEDTSGLKNLMNKYIGSKLSDPKSTDDMIYRYDTNVNCSAPNQRALYITKVETNKLKNWTEVGCDCVSSCGFAGGKPDDGYIILLQ